MYDAHRQADSRQLAQERNGNGRERAQRARLHSSSGKSRPILLERSVQRGCGRVRCVAVRTSISPLSRSAKAILVAPSSVSFASNLIAMCPQPGPCTCAGTAAAVGAGGRITGLLGSAGALGLAFSGEPCPCPCP
jgi:hypothetical protein